MAVTYYRDLLVWQKAMDLVVEIYPISARFPREEQFGLTNQIRRSAVSVPANIAEGHGRFHTAEFLHFLSIARGSLSETETHVQISLRLSYLRSDELHAVDELIQHTGRLLNGLINSLDNKTNGHRLKEDSEPYDPDQPLTPDP
jgi:four helix bundle protein